MSEQIAWALHEGDALEVLRRLEPESAHALVTDPPSGIGFLGNSWDGDRGGRAAWVDWLRAVMVEALQVLRPGAYGLVWALPRTSHWTALALEDAGFEIRDCVSHFFGDGFPKSKSSLKPAAEFWWLVRKPLVGNVESNVASYECGALNIEEARAHGGRWPPNVVLSHAEGCSDDACDAEKCPIAMLDEQSGILTSGSRKAGAYRKLDKLVGTGAKEDERTAYPALESSSGGASRFFPRFRYEAKANDRDREFGLAGRKKNTHPTVKPVELMRWLVRLVAPGPGGVVLDPFAGSGTTGVACALEGHDFVGVELDEEFAKIATARISKASVIGKWRRRYRRGE